MGTLQGTQGVRHLTGHATGHLTRHAFWAFLGQERVNSLKNLLWTKRAQKRKFCASLFSSGFVNYVFSKQLRIYCAALSFGG